MSFSGGKYQPWQVVILPLRVDLIWWFVVVFCASVTWRGMGMKMRGVDISNDFGANKNTMKIMMMVRMLMITGEIC